MSVLGYFIFLDMYIIYRSTGNQQHVRKRMDLFKYFKIQYSRKLITHKNTESQPLVVFSNETLVTIPQEQDEALVWS